MEFGGHYYYDKGENKATGARYYACRKSRDQKIRCKARLTVSSDGTIVESDVGHTCDKRPKHLDVHVINIRDKMRAVLEEHAIKKRSGPPSRVWTQVKDSFVTKYGELSGLQIYRYQEGVQLIRRVRLEESREDALRVIELGEHRTVSEEDEHAFVQFNLGFSVGEDFRHIGGFGHPDLIRQMRHPGVTLFVDATFKITPKPFMQTIIIMMYDSAHDYYVPCFYVLTENKDQETYGHVFNWVKIQCQRKCKPAVVVCDFELALHNLVREEFEGAYLVGCRFHWKQALRRKMLELHIPVDQVEVAMTPGYIDTLTVVPHKKVRNKGIPYVTKKLYGKIDRTGHKPKWDAFWAYFVATWCSDMFAYDCWNISSMVKDGVEIVNRTNNPLEASNRRLADALSTPHPGMIAFLDGLKEQASLYLNELKDIRAGRRHPPERAELLYLRVPRL